MFVEHRLRGVDPEFFKLRSPTQIPPAEPKEIATAEFSEGPIDGGFLSMGVPKNELTSIDNHGVFSTIFPNKNHPFVGTPMYGIPQYLWPPLRIEDSMRSDHSDRRRPSMWQSLNKPMNVCDKIVLRPRFRELIWGLPNMGGGVSQFLDVFFQGKSIYQWMS